MDFLVNDLSLHGQFSDLISFRSAIEQVMAIRQISQKYGRVLYCHRCITQASVTPTMKMPQAVNALRFDERRALMQWLTQWGPFWEDARNHQPNDWLECNDSIVTDSAVGEAGWCCLNHIERGLVSITPSNWLFTPVPVDLVLDNGSRESIDVMNYWSSTTIEGFLKTLPAPVNSWGQLEEFSRNRFAQLTFTEDAFEPLNGYPFVYSASQRFLFIFEILNQLKSCYDINGNRTPEGHKIYKDFFTGKTGDGGRGALFSDSSDDEKIEFNTQMTFKHPGDASKELFCSWHGKVQTPQLRVHYSTPIEAYKPLYVVYIGPKITKR